MELIFHMQPCRLTFSQIASFSYVGMTVHRHGHLYILGKRMINEEALNIPIPPLHIQVMSTDPVCVFLILIFVQKHLIVVCHALNHSLFWALLSMICNGFPLPLPS